MLNTVSCVIFLMGRKKCLLMIVLNNQSWKLKKPYDQINLLYYLSVLVIVDQLVKNPAWLK